MNIKNSFIMHLYIGIIIKFVLTEGQTLCEHLADYFSITFLPLTI
jgi:hypothetical protein